MGEIEQDQVEEVMAILSDWNPLGRAAASVRDLDNYKTEAIDIIFESQMRRFTKATVCKVVQEVLNEAFGLDLTRNDCVESAAKIFAVLSE